MLSCRRIILWTCLLWVVLTPLQALFAGAGSGLQGVALDSAPAEAAGQGAAGGGGETQGRAAPSEGKSGPETSWGRYAAGCVALPALLLGPGFWLWARRRGGVGELGWVPVPGVLAAAAAGLLLWITGAAKTSAAEWVMACWGLVGLCGVVVGLRSALGRGEREAAGVIGVYAAGVCLAQFLWLHPARIATEIWPDNAFRGRMVASPPDHVIPFFTAAYMHHGKDGRESRKEYFGVEWAITSRGPLAPLAINAGFTLMREHMHDPVAMPGGRWPADEEGFWVARILGAALNGLVVFGLVPLLVRLGAEGRGRVLFGTALLAATPLAVLHTGFLWPKLLASYFGCLALADALGRRSPWRTGLWLALAYLSHPVGGLLWPAALIVAAWPAVRPVIVAGAWRDWRPASMACLRLLAAVFLPLLPWLLYQRWIHHPELLWNYPLGDGREWLPADSWASWWDCRWKNLCRTFVPLCFYLSDHARQYGNGVIEGWLRWALQAQFALPGALGLGVFGAAFWACVRCVHGERSAPASGEAEPESRRACLTAWFAVAATVVVMLLYWGYGAGGLGRDCLQPVAVWMAALAAAQAARVRPWLRTMLLAATLLESALVLGIGFACA